MDSFVLHPSAAQTRPPGYVRLARGSSRMRAPRYAESDIDPLLASVRTRLGSPEASTVHSNQSAARFVPEHPRSRRVPCLSAPLETLQQALGGAGELDDPGGEPQVLPELHGAPVGGEGLELDPADPPVGRESGGLVDQLPADPPSAVASPHHHPRELQGPL